MWVPKACMPSLDVELTCVSFYRTCHHLHKIT